MTPGPVSDPSGRVIFVPPPSASGVAYDSFAFEASDGESTSLPATNVLNVAPEPVIEPIGFSVVAKERRQHDKTVMKTKLLEAIDLALAGEWKASHAIVQDYENDATAAWIHAVLHKIEGDQNNSRYWYNRANKLDHFADEPNVELAEIRKEIAD